MKGVIRTVSCIAAAAALFSGVNATACLAAERPTKPVRVTVDTQIVAEDASSELRVRIPLDGQHASLINRLRSTRTGFSWAYQEVLERALRAGGVLRGNHAREATEAMQELPRLRIDGDEASLAIRLPWLFLWRELDDETLGAKVSVPDHARLSISLRTPNAAPESADPLPNLDDGNGTLRWNLANGSSATLMVGLGEPVPAASPTLSQEAVSSLVLSLPFLCLIALAIAGIATGSRRISWPLSLLATAGIIAAATNIASFHYIFSMSHFDENSRLLLALIPVPAILFFVGMSKEALLSRLAFATTCSLVLAAIVSGASLTQPQLTAAGALGIIMLTFVIDASVRWLWNVWPLTHDGSRRTLPRGITAAIVLVGLALGAHYAFVLDKMEVGFNAALIAWSVNLEANLPFLPAALSNLALHAATVLLGIGIAIWLWEQAENNDSTFGSWHECFAVALMVATAFIGTGGRVGGYSIPIAFILTLVSITIAARTLSRTARGRRRRANRSESEVTGLEALAIAVSSGNEGARGRLVATFRRGWWVVLIPAVYSAFAVLDFNLGDGFSAPVETAFIVVDLFGQISMWLIVAWAFLLLVPVLPGGNGLLKGLIAGLFCAAPTALAGLVTEDAPSLEQWLFVSAGLTLLLVSVGLLVDYRAVQSVGGGLRQLIEHYSTAGVTTGLAYLVPVAFVLFNVIQGLADGSGINALGELASAANSLSPGSSATDIPTR